MISIKAQNEGETVELHVEVDGSIEDVALEAANIIVHFPKTLMKESPKTYMRFRELLEIAIKDTVRGEPRCFS